ncbi:MAG: ABC transporter substrate-binding protein, partial [Candidatus Kapaibacterium sp.]
MSVIIVGLLVVLSSCSQERVVDAETTFSYNEPNGITSLDPARAGYQAAIWAGTQLYNGLVERDSDLRIVPCVAQRWESDKSGTRWVFHLRGDVMFHEDPCFGAKRTRAVTSADVEYSILRLLDVRTKSPGLWVFQKRIKGAMEYIEQTRRGGPASCEGIRCRGDSVIEIDLTEPFAPFLPLLSMPYAWIVPREAVEHYGEEFSRHPVGTGPFRMDHWTPDIELVLRRNERYFKSDGQGKRLPYLQRVHVSFVRDTKTEFMEFRKGGLDILA